MAFVLLAVKIVRTAGNQEKKKTLQQDLVISKSVAVSCSGLPTYQLQESLCRQVSPFFYHRKTVQPLFLAFSGPA